MQENMLLFTYTETTEFYPYYGESYLIRLTKFQDKPVLLVAELEGIITARACVPPKIASDHFNAKLWLQSFANVVGGVVNPPKGQGPTP